MITLSLVNYMSIYQENALLGGNEHSLCDLNFFVKLHHGLVPKQVCRRGWEAAVAYATLVYTAVGKWTRFYIHVAFWKSRSNAV